jgi:phosphate/sulfate permease
MAFEATNGFHDAANAVATVIYTKSLKPGQAVVLSGILSGIMNFLGVLIGGISVAYILVELHPGEVLSPPSGGPAVGMLVALFIAAKSGQSAKSREISVCPGTLGGPGRTRAASATSVRVWLQRFIGYSLVEGFY